MHYVALRKESVDRNVEKVPADVYYQASLSARRAWIEITYVARLPRAQVVALRKESVDRNIVCVSCAKLTVCRSPQGERG